MIDRDPFKCCPCCGTTEHLEHAAYNPTIGGIWQFVYCASCGARGDGDPMDANGARDQWNRGPIQIRAEVA